MTEGEEHLLDLSRFDSRAVSLSIARGRCPTVYTELARESFPPDGTYTSGQLLYLSFVSRLRGLHEGSIAAIEANNPHAAFPLLRAMAEVVTSVMYTVKVPMYIEVLTGLGPDSARSAKSFTAMFDALRDQAPGLRDVYRELSEYAHFRQLGIYNVHRIEDEVERKMSWTDVPQWKSEREFKIACAQLAELAGGAENAMRRYLQTVLHARPPSGSQSE